MKLYTTRLITVLYLAAALSLFALSVGGVFWNPAPVAPKKAETGQVESKPGGTTPSEGTPSALPFLPGFFESQPAGNMQYEVAEIFRRLFAAVILTAFLAYRPKKSIPLFARNFHVIQTQILLAVVAASLMMIVGNNAARAFAIFAAVSLVRFRTNIRNPKEVTVLLVSLAIGLAAGVGYWQLGMILCFFVMTLLWFLEYNEDEHSFRSMELTVKTTNVKRTRALLQATFKKYDLEWELRRLDLPVAPGEVGRFSYFLNLRLDVTTDDLTQRIMALDSENISDVNWNNKRKALQIYE